MKCTACGYDAPEGSAFCGKCGGRLDWSCGCGHTNPPDHRFCSRCGTAFDPSGALRDSEPGPVEAHADRRQLTVMFCDLVGSTALSDQLDPEDLREVVREYQRVASDVTSRWGGHTAQHLGDGILVYFGYPQAFEDAPQRAVAAGLGVVEAVAALARRLEREMGVNLAVRVGIHTGMVVVGEMGSGATREKLAMGRTPNVAARLEGLAEPGTVVISARTRALVRGSFECESLGEREIKGVPVPMEVFRPLRSKPGGARKWSDSDLNPVVGRQEEREFLALRLDRLREGEASAVHLIGEPGIGKSRLVQLTEEMAEQRGYRRLLSGCSPLHQNTALFPVIEMLRQGFGLEDDDPAETKWDKIDRALGSTGDDGAARAALLAALLGLPSREDRPLPDTSPERQREDTLNGVIGFLGKRAAADPTVLIVEDLHWVDPSTIELLGRLLDTLDGTGILLLLTSRPSFDSPWDRHERLTDLRLRPLGELDVVDLARVVAGGKPMPLEVTRLLVEKTDGVPLFVEEMTRMVMERGWVREAGDRYELSVPLTDLKVPYTLKDLLTARLDRLGQAREIAQIAAVLGREFSYELIAAVSNRDPRWLERELEQLVGSGLLRREGVLPEATFTFHHSLIQDTAYDMLLKRNRRYFHQQTARVLADRFPSRVEEEPEVAAYHCTHGGLEDKAIGYWHKAGRLALQRSANIEAIEHLNKGLELIGKLDDAMNPLAKELELRGALSPALMATQGWASKDLESTLGRSLELVDSMGEGAYALPVLWGIWSYHQLRGHYDEAMAMAERNLEIARRSGDSGGELEALICLADSQWYRGMFPESIEGFGRAVEKYDPEEHGDHAYVYGLDPRLFARCHIGLTHWYLGRPEEARRHLEETEELAEGTGHANSTATVLFFLCVLAQHEGEIEETFRQAGRLLEFAEEHGFLQWIALGKIMRGWSEVLLGKGDDTTIHEGVEMFRRTGAGISLTLFRFLHAEAQVRLGRLPEGRRILEECIERAESKGERFYLAELLRARGDWAIKDPEAPEGFAEDSYRRAIEVAEGQSAQTPRRRAARALAALLAETGRAEEEVV